MKIYLALSQKVTRRNTDKCNKRLPLTSLFHYRNSKICTELHLLLLCVFLVERYSFSPLVVSENRAKTRGSTRLWTYKLVRTNSHIKSFSRATPHSKAQCCGIRNLIDGIISLRTNHPMGFIGFYIARYIFIRENLMHFVRK